LHYAWSLPVSTAILGCQTVGEVEADVRLAAEHKKLSDGEMESLRASYAGVDFAKLEPWKVPAEQRVSQAKYLGD
jgi:hypothetical protein